MEAGAKRQRPRQGSDGGPASAAKAVQASLVDAACPARGVYVSWAAAGPLRKGVNAPLGRRTWVPNVIDAEGNAAACLVITPPAALALVAERRMCLSDADAAALKALPGVEATARALVATRASSRFRHASIIETVDAATSMPTDFMLRAISAGSTSTVPVSVTSAGAYAAAAGGGASVSSLLGVIATGTSSRVVAVDNGDVGFVELRPFL
jgi:hypothetical protein